MAFMNRKKAEAAGQPFSGYGADASNTHGAPSAAAAPVPAAAAPAAAGGLSAEQQAFMNRKKSEQVQKLETLLPSAAPAAPVPAGGFSAEQLAFMERKKTGAF